MNESPFLVELFARQKHAALEERIHNVRQRTEAGSESSHRVRAAVAAALTWLALRLDTRAGIRTTLSGR